MLHVPRHKDKQLQLSLLMWHVTMSRMTPTHERSAIYLWRAACTPSDLAMPALIDMHNALPTGYTMYHGAFHVQQSSVMVEHHHLLGR